MRYYIHDHPNATATEVAEQASDEFDLYEDHIDYVIPEWVFEIAGEIVELE